MLTCFVLCFQSWRPSAVPDLLDGDGLTQKCGKRDRVPQQLPTSLEHAPVDNEGGNDRCHATIREGATTKVGGVYEPLVGIGTVITSHPHPVCTSILKHHDHILCLDLQDATWFPDTGDIEKKLRLSKTVR